MSEFNINSQFTLAERAKGTLDGKRMMFLLDVMDERGVEGFIKDVPWFAANQGLQHKIWRTTSHPDSSRRTFYEGVTITEITTQKIVEPVVLFEQWSSVDEQHVKTLENGNEERARRDKIKILAMQEDFVLAIFTDNRTSGDKFLNGFSQRMGTLSYPGHTTTTLPYVWDAGGTGSALTSLYLIEWGEAATHGIFPSGAAGTSGVMGMNAVNLGLQTVLTATTPLTQYRAFQSQFTHWAGLAVNDDRKVARIANIETRTGITVGRFNENVLIRAIKHGRFNRSRTRIYVNPFLSADIDIRAKDKINGWTTQQVFGEDVTAFQGIPVRMMEDTFIPADESAVA